GLAAVTEVFSRDRVAWHWRISEVSEERAGELLARVIEGRGAFRRFKDTLLDFPQLRERWFTFHDARMRRRAMQWLADEGVVSLDQAERAASEHPDPYP